METCYKVFRREILQQITPGRGPLRLRARGHGQGCAPSGAAVYEVSISYEGRSYDAGKKIGWKDGVRTIWCILKFNIWARQRPVLVPESR